MQFRSKSFFLSISFVFCLTTLCPAAVWATSDRFFFSGDGVVSIRHGHFSEHLEIRYRDTTGEYDSRSIGKISHLFRSREDGAEGEVSLRLIELIDWIEDRYEPKEIVLVSGYRSPEYNDKIRSKGARAAQASLHTEGLAADLKFEGLHLKNLWISLREHKIGGVGYYRKDGFLHVDTGRPRFWEPQTSKVEQNVSAGNAKLFARTEFDRYATLDRATIDLYSLTAFPVRIARTAEVGKLHVQLEPSSDSVTDDGDCLLIRDAAAAYKLRVVAPDVAAPAQSTVIRLHTCPQRVEATPASFESNPIERLSR